MTSSLATHVATLPVDVQARIHMIHAIGAYATSMKSTALLIREPKNKGI